MPPRRAPCQICNTNESKYSCSKCLVLYCSVACYKQHKGLSPLFHSHARSAKFKIFSRVTASTFPSGRRRLEVKKPLRPLTSLHWPYVPEESAYPDPLKRDDPKPLQLHQYEAIATSQAIRRALATHPRLKEVLRHIDSLRGTQREQALQHALGVSKADAMPDGSLAERERGVSGLTVGDDDRKALRALAEAVEAAVRGGREDILGLDWSDSEA
ncbi:hypothetical protein DENSPDRAFT_895341 [Dentipellis sp. KUC8613]|nr:hypothetical protein DENSPDRAFT_895341 [Dentipellis sp. KUC8613]